MNTLSKFFTGKTLGLLPFLLLGLMTWSLLQMPPSMVENAFKGNPISIEGSLKNGRTAQQDLTLLPDFPAHSQVQHFFDFSPPAFVEGSINRNSLFPASSTLN